MGARMTRGGIVVSAFPEKIGMCLRDWMGKTYPVVGTIQQLETKI